MYPQNNEVRCVISLDGLWDFKLLETPYNESDVTAPLEDALIMPIPASYNDLYMDRKIRNHAGDVVYQRKLSVPKQITDQKLWLRFESVTHAATVFLNEVKLGTHTGGFLPFEFDITDAVQDGVNMLTVVVNNLVTYETIPCGRVEYLNDSSGNRTLINYPNFDFFNYSGIMRPVKLYTTPKTYISDISLDAKATGDLSWEIEIAGSGEEKPPVSVFVKDRSGHIIYEGTEYAASTNLKDIELWSADSPVLYDFEVRLGDGGDCYTEQFGFRSVAVKEDGIYLNGEKVYLKGFGKHEDFPILGRGFNEAVNVKDINLLKWMGANSFRTSHYPYSEEMMFLCDRCGILVINETPAVGLNIGFTATGMLGGNVQGTWKTLKTKAAHEQAIRELIKRDKNHPCVVMWSVANEAATQDEGARDYFAPLFEMVRQLDPQDRPVTAVTYDEATPESCEIAELCDVLCINRYYGWYTDEEQLGIAKDRLRQVFEAYRKRCPDKPIMLTEYGADTIAGMHDEYAGLFSEEFQVEFLKAYSAVFDELTYIAGEHVWNFADFATAANIKRVQGNKKGVFTRDRKPKMAAWYLKKRWSNLD